MWPPNNAIDSDFYLSRVRRQVIAYLRTGELGPVDQPGFFDQ